MKLIHRRLPLHKLLALRSLRVIESFASRECCSSGIVFFLSFHGSLCLDLNVALFGCDPSLVVFIWNTHTKIKAL